MRLKGFLLVVTAWLGASQSSEAVLSDTFVLDFSGGALAGESFIGDVSWDESALTGSGFEELGPIGGSIVPGGVLSFDLTIGPDSFSLSDAGGFPDFPILAFFDGDLVDIDFITDFAADPFLEMVLGGASYFPSAGGEPSFGTYTVGSPVSTPDAGLGTMAFAVLFGGMFAMRRGRR